MQSNSTIGQQQSSFIAYKDIIRNFHRELLTDPEHKIPNKWLDRFTQTIITLPGNFSEKKAVYDLLADVIQFRKTEDPLFYEFLEKIIKNARLSELSSTMDISYLYEADQLLQDKENHKLLATSTDDVNLFDEIPLPQMFLKFAENNPELQFKEPEANKPLPSPVAKPTVSIWATCFACPPNLLNLSCTPSTPKFGNGL